MTKDKDPTTLNNNSEAEVTNELSKVSASQAKNIVLLGILCVIFLALFYNFFIKDTSDQTIKKVIPKLESSQIIKPSTEAGDLPEVPKLPEPKLVEPVVLPPPLPEIPVEKPTLPALPTATTLPAIPANILPGNILPGNTTITTDKDAIARREAKRRSTIVLKDSSATTDIKSSEAINGATVVVINPLPPEYLLGRGKIIDAVLESAINTDFGGEVRAIISRNVFSEAGKNILIPKGSRLFGSYSTGTGSLYGRIEVIWNSVSLPSGGSLKLNAYAMDNLGRKGVEGRVDNKYTEKMTNAVLTSAFNVLAGQITDKLVPPVTANSASTAAQATSTNITTAVNALLSDSTKTYADICTAIRNAFTDKTLSAYTQADTQCNSLDTSSASVADRKTTAANIATTTAASLLTTANQTTTATKAQQAAQDGYTNITDTLKDILQQKQNYTPTISIDQGKPIKIYVNTDYLFPKSFVTKSKMVNR